MKTVVEKLWGEDGWLSLFSSFTRLVYRSQVKLVENNMQITRDMFSLVKKMSLSFF